ncbi:MAG TPA: gamma-glutamyltransferase, partial [Kiloniellaceae bacterium]|nr:gamma-glutamyltransferase [Kiloniellaceae bacterium]
PGGSRIITMLLQGILALAEGAGPGEWVRRPRIHHQYLPDEIQYEPNALSEEEIAELKRRGHQLKKLERPFGNMQAIYWNRKDGKVEAASDPRGIGRAVVR